ncbi:MAG TPA: glycosyltransferase [Longimicrobiales bacterium]|nr:glycosyltransferase [Longimicrobiales bacterium]
MAVAPETGRGRAPRVAYIMSRFPKITETFVLYEMKALEELGARVEVFPLLREPPGPRHREAAAYEARAHFVPFLSREVLRANWSLLRRDPRRYLSTWWHVVKGTWGSLNFLAGALACYPKCVLFAERMIALDVDHVHAHFANHPALAALVIHRLTGIPYSFTAHGSDLHVERRMLEGKVGEAAFVVAVSAYNRELILRECGAEHGEKVRVIHCGVDPSSFADVSARSGNGSRPARPEGSLRIACVASLDEVKGHRFLLHACKLLLERGVHTTCELAGAGRLRPEIERLAAQLGIRERVRLHGAVPRSQVQRILADADVAVLASHPTRSGKREGIPVALMEAMMSGLPVVASGVSGIPELVEDGCTGYLVPPGDPWSLAERLERLARDPALRETMGRAGRQKVLAEFDLTSGARLLLEAVRRHGRVSQQHDT